MAPKYVSLKPIVAAIDEAVKQLDSLPSVPGRSSPRLDVCL